MECNGGSRRQDRLFQHLARPASVFKDVPPDVIVGGNPAKVLKPREIVE